MSIATLHAVADTDIVAIKAAAEKLPNATKRLMAQAGISINGKRISIAEVDRALMALARPLEPTDRIALKLSLERAGLIEG